MRRIEVTHSFVVRVERTDGGERLVVQDLASGERLEFASWDDLARHLRIRTRLARLPEGA